MSPRRAVHHRVFLIIFFVLIALTAGNSFSSEVVPLKIILNSVDMGESLVVMTEGGDVLVPLDEIKKTRLREGLGSVEEYGGERYISLKSIKGLEFSVNEKDVSVEITADPYLFKEEVVDLSYKRSYEVTYTKANSAFLNYNFFYDTGDDSIDFSTEVGVRLGDYLGTSTFDYLKDQESNNLVRLMTTVTRDYREDLRTLDVGDFTALSGPLGTATLQGGVMFSKNYEIDPYFLQFPPLSFRGALTAPSVVDVYVDDQLVRTERLQPGEFELSNIPSIVGYGKSKIVIRDVFGKETTVTNPFFYSDRLLRKGLSEYSYSLGFVREDFGEKSFNYGKLALQGFHRYGFSEKLLGGFTLEASGGLISAGPTASFLLSNYGVVDAALALSNSEGKSGYGTFLNYFFKSRNFTASVSYKALSRYFSNLTTSPTDDKTAVLFSASAGMAFIRFGTITAQYSASRPYESADTSRYGLLYDRNISSRTNIFATASKTEEEGGPDSNEFFLGFHIYFGANTSGNLSYANNGGDVTRTAAIQRNLPLGTGYGYRAQIDNSADRTDINVGADYQNDYGFYGVNYRDADGDQRAQFTVAGGIGYIDRTTFVSRPITDSFAKVKLDGLEGVRVRYFNNEVGRTDKNGSVIIPVINSYRDNRIDIEKDDIPIEYAISTVKKYINPPLRSGSVVVFDVRKIQALSGKIYVIEDGVKVPVEFSVMTVILKDKTLEGLVGKDGEFYIENVPSGSYSGQVFYKESVCRFDLEVPESAEVFVDAGEVICAVEK
ncbi:MAG: fimbria/pilus outer membrane usher protein [Thermodesulfobacteriota bacterium]|nr:MAG: fimbria/pilus outer membrane usher protein [Thermodesulfobacteriota bacterium]